MPGTFKVLSPVVSVMAGVIVAVPADSPGAVRPVAEIAAAAIVASASAVAKALAAAAHHA